jgi:hypothetical protein
LRPTWQTRAGSSEDVVARNEDLVCQERVFGYDQLDDYVLSKGADESKSIAEKVIVIGMCERREDWVNER